METLFSMMVVQPPKHASTAHLPTAAKTEFLSKIRELQKENHPGKAKDAAISRLNELGLRTAAETYERFADAYEALSNAEVIEGAGAVIDVSEDWVAALPPIEVLWDAYVAATLLAEGGGTVGLLKSLISLRHSLLKETKTEGIIVETITQMPIPIPMDLLNVRAIKGHAPDTSQSTQPAPKPTPPSSPNAEAEAELKKELKALTAARQELQTLEVASRMQPPPAGRERPPALPQDESVGDFTIPMDPKEARERARQIAARREAEPVLNKRAVPDSEINDALDRDPWMIETKSMSANLKKAVLGNIPAKPSHVNVAQATARIDEEVFTAIKGFPVAKATTERFLLDGVEIEDAQGRYTCLPEHTGLSYCDLLKKLSDEDPQTTPAIVLGTGEYKVVRESFNRLQAGGLAKVKNILPGESFKKIGRTLDRTEETRTSSSERETSSSNEMATTERSDMRTQSKKEVEKQFDQSLSVGLSASYGGVLSVNVNGALSSSTTSKAAKSASQSFARTVTEKAESSLREKTVESRSTKQIREAEFTSTYKLVNESQLPSVNIYRWVDAVYTHQIFTVGQRLVITAFLPDPMAFFLFARTRQNGMSPSVKKPIHPSKFTGVPGFDPLESYRDLTRDNAHLWAAAYGVNDFTPAPTHYQTVHKGFEPSGSSNSPARASWTMTTQIPEGYQLTNLKMGGRTVYNSAPGESWNTLLATHAETTINGWWTQAGSSASSYVLDRPLTGEFSISGLSVGSGYINFELRCEVTQANFDMWRTELYGKILNAYEADMDAYTAEISMAKIERGVNIKGDNPRRNEKTVREELKKWMSEVLLVDRFENWDAMRYAKTGEPEIDFNKLDEMQPKIAFLEHALEWEAMSYIPYGYHYHAKANHARIRELSNPDPAFLAMLRASYCQVSLTVRQGFETEVANFLMMGQTWEPGDVPDIDDPLYLSIATQIANSTDDEIGVPDPDTWESFRPTNEVWLQNSDPNAQLS